MSSEQTRKIDAWLTEHQNIYNTIKDEIERKNEIGEDTSFEDWEDHDYYENIINGFIECLLIINPDYYTNRLNGKIQGEEKREV